MKLILNPQSGHILSIFVPTGEHMKTFIQGMNFVKRDMMGE
jgi:hypothetical protein